MSTWSNVINTNSDYKIFYADAQVNGMSGDFCKEYRLFNSANADSVIVDANETVGMVGNLRIEAMIKNSLVPAAFLGDKGNTVLLSSRIHVDTVDNTKFNGVHLLYDGSRTFTLCYGYLSTMNDNILNNTVISKNITTEGTVTIRWDVITTTDNQYILTKLEQWNGTTWAKLFITGFNIPNPSYTSGRIGIGSCNLVALSPNNSSFFDAVKIYLPA